MKPLETTSKGAVAVRVADGSGRMIISQDKTTEIIITEDNKKVAGKFCALLFGTNRGSRFNQKILIEKYIKLLVALGASQTEKLKY